MYFELSSFINKFSDFMSNSKEDESLVLVDLCKPYGIDMTKEAIDNKVIFFGYPLLNLENNNDNNLDELFEKIAEIIDNNYTEDIRCNDKDDLKSKDLHELAKIISKLIDRDKFNSIIFYPTDNDKLFNRSFDEFKDKLKSIEKGDDSKIYSLINKKYIIDNSNKDNNNKNSPYHNTKNSINKIIKAQNVYVIIPHNPYVTIGKLAKSKLYSYPKPETLANLFYKFICKLKCKDLGYYKDYCINNDKTNNDKRGDILFNRKNMLGQFLQAFEIKETKDVEITEIPLQYLMIRGTTRIIKEENAAYEKINSIYTSIGKVEKGLSWLTPTYFEMLSLTLLKYKYNKDGNNYEAYHTGGSGDFGIDGIIMDNNNIIAILQCKSGDIGDSNIDSIIHNIEDSIDKENTKIYIATRGIYKPKNKNKEKFGYKFKDKENVIILDKEIILQYLKSLDLKIFENFPDYKLIEEIVKTDKT